MRVSFAIAFVSNTTTSQFQTPFHGQCNVFLVAFEIKSFVALFEEKYSSLSAILNCQHPVSLGQNENACAGVLFVKRLFSDVPWFGLLICRQVGWRLDYFGNSFQVVCGGVRGLQLRVKPLCINLTKYPRVLQGDWLYHSGQSKCKTVRLFPQNRSLQDAKQCQRDSQNSFWRELVLEAREPYTPALPSLTLHFHLIARDLSFDWYPHPSLSLLVNSVVHQLIVIRQ